MSDPKMKKRTKIIIGSAAALAVVGGLAVAGGAAIASGWEHVGKRAGHHAVAMFERFDTDKDDRITAAEISAFKEKTFSTYDADKNASINLDEFQGIWMEHTRTIMVDGFQRMDEDGDGEITESEIDTKLNRAVRWIDRNDDGDIEFKEIRAHRHGKKYGFYEDDDDDDDDDDDKQDRS